MCVCEEVSPDVAVLVFGLDEGSSRSAKDSPVGGEGWGGGTAMTDNSSRQDSTGATMQTAA